jgi:tetratricopeptide (TPR) repeat protein
MAPAAARETLRELVGLDVEQLEDELGRIFRQRTEAWRDKRDAQAVVDDLRHPPEVPRQVSTDLITEEFEASTRRVAEFEELRGIAERAKRNYETASATVTRLQGELADAELEVTRTLEKWALSDKAIDAFTIPDFDEIKQRLDSALAQNKNADKIQEEQERYVEKEDEAEACAMLWKNLDTEHNGIAHQIKKLTEAVEYPIEDLELRPEGVFYQGVPFEQGSRAERIKVSLAMGMAMNDKLRILLIRDGSVLDQESMATIAKLAEEKDFQFWIEMARGYEGAAGAVVIEDGGVV